MNPTYHDLRLGDDGHRRATWRHLSKYLQRWIDPTLPAVDLGAGRSDFLKEISVPRKIAIDNNDDAFGAKSGDIEHIVADATRLHMLDDGSVGTMLASNFLEHLERDAVSDCLEECHRVLAPGGHLIVIQPNFRIRPEHYFDDYTHRTIITHHSLRDWMESKGLEVVRVEPRFLPLTLKSRLRHGHRLMPLYLALPFRPFASQMLVIGRRPNEDETNV